MAESNGENGGRRRADGGVWDGVEVVERKRALMGRKSGIAWELGVGVDYDFPDPMVIGFPRWPGVPTGQRMSCYRMTCGRMRPAASETREVRGRPIVADQTGETWGGWLRPGDQAR